jgi:hypothetical protein
MMVAANSALMWMINNKRLPEDEDDWTSMLLEGFLAYLPVFGDDIIAGLKGWDANANVLSEISNLAGKTLARNKMSIKAQIKLVEELLGAAGVPVVAGKRVIEFAKTGDPLELLGGEPRRR